MWIFSTVGFFSIVRKAHPKAPGRPIQIRARSLDDLEALAKYCRLAGAEAEVIVTHDADYAGRLAVKAETLGAIMATLPNAIDYPNFKGAMAELPRQRDKLRALHEVWEVMHDYQVAKHGKSG